MRRSYTLSPSVLRLRVPHGDGNPVVWVTVNRPDVREVLEVHPVFDSYVLRHKAGDFGQRHLRALRGFLEVALPHIPALEPVLARLVGLEGEARKHDAHEAQQLIWSTPLDELQWAKPALEDALGEVMASEAATSAGGACPGYSPRWMRRLSTLSA